MTAFGVIRRETGPRLLVDARDCVRFVPCRPAWPPDHEASGALVVRGGGLDAAVAEATRLGARVYRLADEQPSPGSALGRRRPG
jgi:hypothetical protein